MIAPHIEYVGFATTAKHREYKLLVCHAGQEPREITLAIATAAFLTGRIRYQDGPDVCFLKAQRELAQDGALRDSYLTVTDADIEEYRQAHAPKPSTRRPRPPVTS